MDEKQLEKYEEKCDEVREVEAATAALILLLKDEVKVI